MISATLLLRLSVDGIDGPSSIRLLKAALCNRSSNCRFQCRTQVVPRIAARVAEFVREQIAAAGAPASVLRNTCITFCMHPDWVITVRARPNSVLTGDFVTAPEVSPIFGRHSRASVRRAFWRKLDSSVNTGTRCRQRPPGRGCFAQACRPQCTPGTQYLILEVSADFSERQQNLLGREVPELVDRVTWVDRLPDEHQGRHSGQ